MKANNQKVIGGIVKICILLVLVFAIVNCTGPEGPMGPQGPRGYDGVDGVDGKDGASFANSVIYDVEPSAWQGNADGYTATLAVPELTEDIYNNGALLIYRLIELEPKSFNMLPYTFVDNGLNIYMDFDAFIGSINLIYKEVVDGVNDTFAPESLMSFKVVIVEGMPLNSLQKMVDIKDFNAVSKMLNLNRSQIKERNSF